jgi:cysteine desulfurase
VTRSPIYLDSFSTTALAPEAFAAMSAAWSEPGNASSPHAAGQRAHAAVERGRLQIATLIGALPSEIVFTSGATEANNLALRGVAEWARRGGSPRRRIIVSSIEHKAVLETAHALSLDGFAVETAPVDNRGLVDLPRLSALMTDETLLVSVMLVNNETGVIQPIEEIGRIARSKGVLLHTDAAQAVGKLLIDVLDLGADYLSISAHKFYGPMGVGALYIAADAPKPLAQISGGGQERGIRSGTEPVPLIAGFGAAAEVAQKRISGDAAHSKRLVTAFLDGLNSAGVKFRKVTGDAPVVSGGLALSFTGIRADELVSKASKYVEISTGSACTSGQVLPSHVLLSMGMSHDEAETVVRFYFSRFNTLDDVSQSIRYLLPLTANLVSGLDDAASPRYVAADEARPHRS